MTSFRGDMPLNLSSSFAGSVILHHLYNACLVLFLFQFPFLPTTHFSLSLPESPPSPLYQVHHLGPGRLSWNYCWHVMCVNLGLGASGVCVKEMRAILLIQRMIQCRRPVRHSACAALPWQVFKRGTCKMFKCNCLSVEIVSIVAVPSGVHNDKLHQYRRLHVNLSISCCLYINGTSYQRMHGSIYVHI